MMSNPIESQLGEPTQISLPVSPEGKRIEVGLGSELVVTVGDQLHNEKVRLTLKVVDGRPQLIVSTSYSSELCAGPKDLPFGCTIRGQKITARLIGHDIMLTHFHESYSPYDFPTPVSYYVEKEESAVLGTPLNHLVKDHVAAVLTRPLFHVVTTPRLGASDLQTGVTPAFQVYPSLDASSFVVSASRGAFNGGSRLNEDGASLLENGEIVLDGMSRPSNPRAVVLGATQAFEQDFCDQRISSHDVAMAAVPAMHRMTKAGTIEQDSGAALGFIRKRQGDEGKELVDLVHCGDVKNLHVKPDGTVAYESLDHSYNALLKADLFQPYHLAYVSYYFASHALPTPVGTESLLQCKDANDFYGFERYVTDHPELHQGLREYCAERLVASRRILTMAGKAGLKFVLTGKADVYFPHVHTATPEPGDTFVSVTDGVTGIMSIRRLASYVASRDFAGLLAELKRRNLSDDTTLAVTCY